MPPARGKSVSLYGVRFIIIIFYLFFSPHTHTHTSRLYLSFVSFLYASTKSVYDRFGASRVLYLISATRLRFVRRSRHGHGILQYHNMSTRRGDCFSVYAVKTGISYTSRCNDSNNNGVVIILLLLLNKTREITFRSG